MNYDFDKPINRRGTNCVKWDEPTPYPSQGEESLDTICDRNAATETNQAPLPSGGDGGGLIPLWVADMDFEAAPAIREALRKRVDHGVFGYAIVQPSYYDAVIRWYERRHQWHIRREWIQYTTGVVPAISAVIKAITMPGERVLILTPVYNCFFSSIRNNGCEVLESKLVPIEAKRPTPQTPTPQTPTPNPSQGEGGLNTLSHQDIATEANQAPLPSGGGGGGYQGGCLLTYSVDWDDFETKCADEKTTVFLLCNPHNPAGRVWTRDELQRMADICQRHHVRVVSDEIHCELVMPGHEFVPFGIIPTPNPSRGEGSLNTLSHQDIATEAIQTPLPSGDWGLQSSHRCGCGPTKGSESLIRDGGQDGGGCQEPGGGCIICCSPSKSFNTAGLQMANIICADPETRRRIDRAININEICDVNPFAPLAVEAAYNEGAEWIDELNQYLWGNYQALLAFFAEHLPQLKVFNLEGTYLVWVDITATGLTSDQIEEKLLSEAQVWVNSGTMYGAEGYIRINIATQRARLMEGLERIARVI